LKNKIIDLVCLCIVGAVFGAVVMLNLLQPNRPTESAAEQRELAKMPEFTIEALADGSYFSGVSSFISDTFLYRDRLVNLSKRIDTLRGVEYRPEGEENFVFLDTSGQANTDEADNELSDKLAEALENLAGSSSSETEETLPEGIQSIVSGEIEEGEETEPGNADEPGMIIVPDDEPDTPSDDEPAETEEPKGEETDAETEEPEQSDEPAPPVNEVTSLKLSKTKLSLTIGSGSVVYASVDTTLDETVNVRWSVSDKNIATISVNPKGGIDVKGVSAGTCSLTCSYGDKIKAVCEINVSEIITTANENADFASDYLTNGLFLYGDAVYTQGFFNANVSKSYAQTALYYKQLFGEDVNVSVVVAPVSAMVLEGTDAQSKLNITDQRAVLDKMAECMDESVNFVDVYTEMFDHREEYLFFKSDHHWTQRGAYYAYRAFANSLGLEPTPLDGFDYEIRNEDYHGSLYNMTLDERVKQLVDTVEVFNPRKPHTMTITTAKGGTINNSSSIVASHKTYLTFISGDHPYTVINVPENPQDKNILVLKDSFGNAMVPFLCEHFGNIIVVDTRYTSMNVYEQLKDYGLTDIVFINNVQAANSSSWSNMYLSAVGVN